MNENFDSALDHVLVHEGGWANHPKDPGGATMKGVTLATFRRHYGKKMTKKDLRNISDAQLKKIYKAGYWSKCKCGELPAGVDYAVFDAAVNSGPGRSAKWLQGAVGAKQDGGIGPNTLKRVKQHSPIQVSDDMCDRRLAFLQSLATWSTFGGGWGRRVDGVRLVAREMAEDGGSLIADIAPSVDYVTTKKGSKGLWVRKLQEALEIQVDGKFGPGTEAVLKAWQKSHGLQADGIAGRSTYRALGLLA
jgi:lysozyme family protein